ncbi:MAG: hypothetical protein JKX76_01020 [Colwellia sp.]|nr:hypothetical protein [Colwellia sp.]
MANNKQSGFSKGVKIPKLQLPPQQHDFYNSDSDHSSKSWSSDSKSEDESFTAQRASSIRKNSFDSTDYNEEIMYYNNPPIVNRDIESPFSPRTPINQTNIKIPKPKNKCYYFKNKYKKFFHIKSAIVLPYGKILKELSRKKIKTNKIEAVILLPDSQTSASEKCSDASKIVPNLKSETRVSKSKIFDKDNPSRNDFLKSCSQQNIREQTSFGRIHEKHDLTRSQSVREEIDADTRQFIITSLRKSSLAALENINQESRSINGRGSLPNLRKTSHDSNFGVSNNNEFHKFVSPETIKHKRKKPFFNFLLKFHFGNFNKKISFIGSPNIFGGGLSEETSNYKRKKHIHDSIKQKGKKISPDSAPEHSNEYINRLARLLTNIINIPISNKSQTKEPSSPGKMKLQVSGGRFFDLSKKSLSRKSDHNSDFSSRQSSAENTAFLEVIPGSPSILQLEKSDSIKNKSVEPNEFIWINKNPHGSVHMTSDPEPVS